MPFGKGLLNQTTTGEVKGTALPLLSVPSPIDSQQEGPGIASGSGWAVMMLPWIAPDPDSAPGIIPNFSFPTAP